jgi:Sulfotransferase domain
MVKLASIARSLWEASKPAARRFRDVAHDLQCLMLPRRLAEGYALPDAVIVGAQKCGTTSLYHYLLHHAAVFRPRKKEIHYFDNNYHHGSTWYRLHFSRRHGGLNFESSPYYLFHPKVPERLAATLPHAKLIVMLRDPVARAYSHYWHERRLGHEHLSFADAVAAEDERLAGESTRLREDDGYRSYNHEHYSYVARGRYVEQIERWFQFFPRNQFLFVDSERFSANPVQEMVRVTAFLGLSPLGEIAWTKQNVGSYADRIEPSLRRALCARFADANRDLDNITGATWSWNR